MEIRRTLLVLACLASLGACRVYGFPPAINPRSPGVGEMLDAGAAILEDVATLEYRVMNLPGARGPKVVAVLDHRRRYKILQESGLDVADVELPIDGYSTLTRVIGRSVSVDGREHMMSSGALEAVSAGPPSERAADIKILRFHVPDAEVGGLVEYRYERVFVDPHLVTPWTFGDRYPVLRSEFGLVVSPNIKADYRYGHGEHIIDRSPMTRRNEAGQERLIFIETDLPAYFNEPLMAHPTRAMPWIAVALRNERLGDSPERLETWQDVGELVLQRMVRVQGRPLPGTVMQRYASIRDRLHPLTVPGVGVRPPVSTGDALLKGAPACSRDAASLVLQSFGGAGVTTYPALLTAPMGPQPLFDFPALYPFVRVVAAVAMTPEMRKDQNCDAEPLKQGPLCGAAVGAGYVFLDPTCKTCAFGTLLPELRGGKALIMGKTTHWVDVPVDSPQHNVLLSAYKLEMDVNGVIKGSVDAEARGVPAAVIRGHLAPNAVDGVEPTEVLREALIGDGKMGPDIRAFRLGDTANADVPLHLSLQVATHAEKQQIERFRVRANDLVGSSVRTAWRGTRRTIALVDGPRWHETGVELILPLGYDAQIRAPLQMATPYAEYAAGFALRGRSLKFSRRLVLKINQIRPEDWHDFQDFINQVDEYEQDGPVVYAPQ